MSEPQDPFRQPTPEQPFGPGYHLPFEETPLSMNDIQGWMADSLDLKAGVVTTPLGKLPVLVFYFRDSSKPGEEQLPPVMLVTTSPVMGNVSAMVQKAVVAARKASKE